MTWVNMLAEEYLVEPAKAQQWVSHSDNREFVVNFLSHRGWKITCYTTPEIEGDRVISHGFVIDDGCDEFIKWKLSQP